MHKLMLMCGMGVLGACAAAAGGTEGPADVATGVATQNSLAYTPMGFARVTAGGLASVAFDSASTLTSPVTVSAAPAPTR